jgi:hypothetical protein
MNVITPVDNTNNIRMADFVRITTLENIYPADLIPGNTYTIKKVGTTDFVAVGASSNTVGIIFTATGTTGGTGYATQSLIYRMSTAPSELTIPAVDALPFNALGTLVQIGDVARDIKSTANETSITIVGIDTALLGWILGLNAKGSLLEMWHGFFNTDGALITTGGTGGLYKFFTGYVNSYGISEQWMEEIRMYVGVISISASSVQIILQNRTAGRYTNDNAWKFFSPSDTSMLRVPFIQTINYPFGKT